MTRTHRPVILLCALSVTAQAFAQTTASPEAPTRPIEHIAGDLITQRAIERIRTLPDPELAEYRLLGVVLEESLRIQPEDDSLARRTAEAWRTVGDSERSRIAMQRVAAIDPHDTVAQLELISYALQARQTTDARLSAYRQLLGPAGEDLHPTVRSRLALDGALLARETGRDDLYADMLRTAVTLDPTNKNAAVIANIEILDSDATPMERIEALVNVLLADPVDAQSHLALGRELLSYGAYEGAHRFLNLAAELFILQTGQLPSEDLKLDLTITQWEIEGGEATLADIEEAEAIALHQIDLIRRDVEENEGDPSTIPVYEPSIIDDRIRLALSSSIGDDAVRDRVIVRMDERIEAEVAALLGDAPDLADPASEAIASQIAGLELELLWSRLLVAAQIEQARAQFDALTTGPLASFLRQETIDRLAGWLAIRENNLETAENLLAPLSSSDFRAAIGMAHIRELQDRQIDAARLYAGVALAEPASLLGMWSRRQIESLLDQPIRPTRQAKDLNDFVSAMPNSLDLMASNPRSYMDLRVRHEPRRVELFDRISAHVTLRNTSSFPLAVGASAPINTRLLFTPRMTSSGDPNLGLSPEVVSFGRRLSLAPGETIEADVWLGQGQTGLEFVRRPEIPVSLRWRVLQAFAVADDGSLVRGPNAMSAESDLLTRDADTLAAAQLDVLLGTVREGEGMELARAIAVASRVVTNSLSIPNEDDRFALLTEVAGEVAQRAHSLDDPMRAVLLILMPSSMRIPEMQAIDDAITPESGRLTALAWMQTRVTSYDDDVLVRMSTSEDPVVREYATTFRLLLSPIPGR